MCSDISLHNILDANKLTRLNFLDWYRNIRIVLKKERRWYILENPIPLDPNEDADEEVRNTYQHYIDDDEHVACVMLASMRLELQTQHKNMDAYTMIIHLKKLFDAASRNDKYETSKELFHCKMINGSLMNTHVLKMIGYNEKLG